ncbi:MAG: hypothetical protein HW416_2646 [Chloroflexi bacterium]|nr:hypothetical protein [Chloroflexota bacterium]
MWSDKWFACAPRRCAFLGIFVPPGSGRSRARSRSTSRGWQISRLPTRRDRRRQKDSCSSGGRDQTSGSTPSARSSRRPRLHKRASETPCRPTPWRSSRTRGTLSSREARPSSMRLFSESASVSYGRAASRRQQTSPGSSTPRCATRSITEESTRRPCSSDERITRAAAAQRVQIPSAHHSPRTHLVHEVLGLLTNTTP